MEEPISKKVVRVVVATQKSTSEYFKTSSGKHLQKIIDISDGLVESEIVETNVVGLSTVYNRSLTQDNDNKIVCFIHDDVELWDSNFYTKLVEGHKMAPILGVAGATRLKIPITMQEPTAWHLMGRVKDAYNKYTTHHSGAVYHRVPQGTFATSFGLVPQNCQLIDGLLISVDVGKANENGLRFDEDFLFHHYDLSFCVQAKMRKMDIRTVDVAVLHNSIGDSLQTSEWKQSHELFVNKYARVINDMARAQ